MWNVGSVNRAKPKIKTKPLGNQTATVGNAPFRRVLSPRWGSRDIEFLHRALKRPAKVFCPFGAEEITHSFRSSYSLENGSSGR